MPLWADDLREQPWHLLQTEVQILSQTIAEKGDIIMFRGKKKGESAAAFNALAKALAILSFAPGGVLFLGVRWKHEHIDITYPTPAAEPFPAVVIPDPEPT